MKLRLMVVIMIMIFVTLPGCFGSKQNSQNFLGTNESTPPIFSDIYRALIENEDRVLTDSFDDEERLTISVNQMPLREFLLYISDRVEASIICDLELDDYPVTVDVVDMKVAEVLSAVARRCGADIIVQNNLYYIGNLQEEDRGFLVRKVRRLNADDIEKVLSSLISDLGRVFASSDGLIVVGDRVRVLQRINSMLDDVERQPANTWIIQMYLIAMSNKGNRDLGFDTSLDIEIGADDSRSKEWTKESSSEKQTGDFDSISNLDISAAFANTTSKIFADSQFRAVLKAARSSTDFQILAEPMMLVIDGGEAKISDGERIPIPQKAISDSGTVTTTGYEYIDTGIIISSGMPSSKTSPSGTGQGWSKTTQ